MVPFSLSANEINGLSINSEEINLIEEENIISFKKNILIETQTLKMLSQEAVYFTETDHRMLLEYMNGRSKKITSYTTENLSDREIDVLKLICLEYTNKEIANQLFLSRRTIENHRQRILEKVGAKNTVGLVVYAIANNIHPIT